MKKFIIKRLVQLIPIIIGITLLSFLLVNVSNTDAIDMLEANRGTAISEEQKNELREELGLDQPVIVRYVVWLKGVITVKASSDYIFMCGFNIIDTYNIIATWNYCGS